MGGLESLDLAEERFTMLELGAGFGRWLVRASYAARWFGNLPCKLTGVEAEPTHLEWMKERFKDNNIDPRCYTLIPAAVSKQDGTAWFMVGRPSQWYGQSIVSPNKIALIAANLAVAALSRVLKRGISLPAESLGSVTKITRVRTVSLKTLSRFLDRVDLVDLDVQGSEYNILMNSSDALNSRVSRVHIETHSREVEQSLRAFFTDLGWRMRWDFQISSVQDTAYGKITFHGGVQSWLNPRFIRKSSHDKTASDTRLGQ